MKTTIDAAGRIVIPKRLRDRLGLVGGEALEVMERDGRLEIHVMPTPMSLKDTRDGPVASTDQKMPPLTDRAVREVLEKTRR
jgi:AbrB family looped-hinge helix DNA binding protein